MTAVFGRKEGVFPKSAVCAYLILDLCPLWLHGCLFVQPYVSSINSLTRGPACQDVVRSSRSSQCTLLSYIYDYHSVKPPNFLCVTTSPSLTYRYLLVRRVVLGLHTLTTHALCILLFSDPFLRQQQYSICVSTNLTAVIHYFTLHISLQIFLWPC